MESEEQKHSRNIKETLAKFCKETMVHGLRFVTGLGHRWIQLFWAIVFFFSCMLDNWCLYGHQSDLPDRFGKIDL